MKIDTKLGSVNLSILALILVGVVYFSTRSPSTSPVEPPVEPTVKSTKKSTLVEKFKSVEDFKNYLEKGKTFIQDFGFRGIFLQELPIIKADGRPEISRTPELQRVSETTVQVPGIDEPDIVKTNGKEIYFSREGFYYRRSFEQERLIKIPPPKHRETKIIKAFPPQDLALDGKIEKIGDLLLKENILVIFSMDGIYGYDVSNPKSPEKKWDIKFKGNGVLVGARLFKDKIYFVTRNRIDEVHPCPIKPLEINGNPLIIYCTQIYHPIYQIPVDVTYNAFILDPILGKIEKNISFIGFSRASIIYMSENGIYVTYSYYGDLIEFYFDFLNERCQGLVANWVIEKIGKLKDMDISAQAKLTELRIILERYKRTLNEDERRRVENELTNRMTKYLKEKKRDLENTGIVKIGLKDFEVLATGEIPGQILNQFSLDEYKGNLRIATTVGERIWSFGFWGEQESANDVYVLDEDLEILGQVKDLGLTERIYSARFIEDKCYLVTFREIDPFYVLDLSNPQEPKLKGELKIPGYSSYLHPIEKDKILGIGKEGRHVKISLFDVSEPQNPKEEDKYLLDESWSDILQTHHAFLQDKKHEIFFLPASRGGYVFSYKGDKLVLKKVVSNIFAKRALYINDYLYIIGENKLVVLDELNWKKVNKIEY